MGTPPCSRAAPTSCCAPWCPALGCSHSDTWSKTALVPQQSLLLASCTLVFADSHSLCLSFRPTTVPHPETPFFDTVPNAYPSSRFLSGPFVFLQAGSSLGAGMCASRYLAYGGSELLLSLVTLSRFMCWLNWGEAPSVTSNPTHLSPG